MYKITFPKERPFTGVYLSVAFKNGEGETDSEYLTERFRGKGLSVEAISDSKPPEDKTPEQAETAAGVIESKSLIPESEEPPKPKKKG